MIWRFGEFELDDRRRQVRRGGDVVALAPKPFAVLVELLKAHPHPLAREVLFDRVWPGVRVTPSSLERAVRAARVALSSAPSDGEVIRTVRGFGYGLIGPVSRPEQSAPLVGRERPLGVLTEALESARNGAGAMVLVAGEPGIGKTCLVEHFACLAETPAAVAVGRAVETEAPTYWEWRSALRLCGEVLPRGRWPSLIRGRERSIFAIAPELAGGVSALSPAPFAPDPAQLSDDVALLLEEASDARPLVLILEDMHWAEPESLHLLMHLGRGTVAGAHVLVVVSYRDRGAPPNPALDSAIAQLAPLRHVRPILGLEPFGRSEIAEFLERESLLRDRFDLIDALARRTGGNPLFVREVARLIEAGPAEMPWDAVPESVAAIVRDRVERLPPDTRAMVEAASVLARESSLGLVARMTDTDEASTLQRLGEAERAGLIEASDPEHARFSHELVRDAVCARMPRERRTALHARAADAIESIHGGWLEPYLADLSTHLWEARPLVDPERAARHARAAGRQAHRRSAFTEAARHYRRALHATSAVSPGEAARRCDLLLELAEVTTQSGEGERASEALDEAASLARRLCDGSRLARVALANTAWSVPLLADGPAIAALEEALARVGEDDAELRLRLLAQLAVQRHFAGERDEGARLLAAVLDESARVEDPQLRSTLLAAHLTAVQQGPAMEPPAERLAMADRAVAAALEAKRPDLVLPMRRMRVSILCELGSADALDAEIDHFAAAGDRVPTRLQRYYLSAFRAGRLLVRGEFDAARGEIAHATRLADLREVSESLFTPTTHRMLLPLTPDEGERVLVVIQQIMAAFPQLRGWRTAPALVYQQLGRREAMQRSLDDNLRDGVAAFLHNNMTDATVLAALTETSHALGDRRWAAELYDLLSPYAGRNVDVGWGIACYGPVDYYRGLAASLLERRDEALAHFDAASELNRRTASRLWEVRNRLGRCRLLARATRPGDGERARTLAREALAEAEALGLRREAKELREGILGTT